MTCCFFGHRSCPDITSELKCVLTGLIAKDDTILFYVGGQGGFDRQVHRVLHDLQKEYPNITCLEVLAYMPGKKQEFELPCLLETIYPDGLEETPRKFAIEKRNRWMVQNSDIVICYIDHSFGGAAKFVEMAERRGKTVINLAI